MCIQVSKVYHPFVCVKVFWDKKLLALGKVQFVAVVMWVHDLSAIDIN